MAYRFKRGDPSVQKGVRRIALGEIRNAIAEIDEAKLTPDEIVHEARTHCKKLRALIRLVRPVFPDYRKENVALRDAAAGLSPARDAAVSLHALAGLKRSFGERLAPKSWSFIRKSLNQHCESVAAEDTVNEQLETFRSIMKETARRARRWKIKDDGFSAIAGGLSATYKNARDAMAEGRGDPSAANLHEWRKRVKDHWYQARLLQSIWPAVMLPHQEAVGELAQLLGDHHDLEILETTFANAPDLFGKRKEVLALLGLIEWQRALWETDAFRLGHKLFALPPAALCRSWESYWQVWKDLQ
jgi:CHAD domain-containing protein